MKTLFYLLLLLLGLIGVERLTHSLTDGFGYQSITSPLPYESSWETSFSSEELKSAQEALNQPYYYLESGSQSYVFVSKDESYVLKFFKHKRWRLPSLIDQIPLPSYLDLKRKQWKQKKKQTVYSTFNSCKVSYEEFKDKTGVFYLHLNPTKHLQQILTVKDGIGLKHQINLDSISFVLQKKATPTDQYLLNLKASGDIERAQEALRDLLNLNLYRAQKGYSDKDPHLIRNFGFLNHQVVEIDIGGFHQDPHKNLQYFYSHEIYRIQKKLLPWLNRYYPELSPYAKEQIKKMIESQDFL